MVRALCSGSAPATVDEPLRLNVSGKNLGMLIGRRGETIAAVQYLTRLMVSHQLQRWVNLVVDVDDYRFRFPIDPEAI